MVMSALPLMPFMRSLSSKESSSEIILSRCSRKALGVTAERSHFSLDRITSSISCKKSIFQCKKYNFRFPPNLWRGNSCWQLLWVLQGNCVGLMTQNFLISETRLLSAVKLSPRAKYWITEGRLLTHFLCRIFDPAVSFYNSYFLPIDARALTQFVKNIKIHDKSQMWQKLSGGGGHWTRKCIECVIEWWEARASSPVWICDKESDDWNFAKSELWHRNRGRITRAYATTMRLEIRILS